MSLAEQRLHETHRDLHATWPLLLSIDQVFARVCAHLDETEEIVGGLLFVRAHSAYRGGVRMAASGQVPEAYMVLRGCLELGLYAAFMAGNPDRQQRWLTRSDTAENRKRFRTEFTVGAMLKAAETQSMSVGEAARSLYGHLIDFGAHPNDLTLGATTTMTRTETPDATRFETSYIVGDGLLARGALKAVARVGVCTPMLFQTVFVHRYQLLGIDVEIERLSNGL